MTIQFETGWKIENESGVTVDAIAEIPSDDLDRLNDAVADAYFRVHGRKPSRTQLLLAVHNAELAAGLRQPSDEIHPELQYPPKAQWVQDAQAKSQAIDDDLAEKRKAAGWCR